jgi:4-methyl-5(b-hydroxyethyl)-thiazole monophosphate biosynthesis
LRRGGVEVKIAGIGGLSAVGANGIAVSADMAVEDVVLADGDMLVLPGGLGGKQEIENSETAMKLVHQAAANDSVWLCAICASPTIFGRAGILQGKKAVCYPGLEGKLTGAEPQMDRHAVVDGKLITGRAPGAAVPFGFALLTALKGEEVANRVRAEMYV